MKKVTITALVATMSVVLVGIWYMNKSNSAITFFEKHEKIASIELAESENIKNLISYAQKENKLYQEIIQEGKENISSILPKINEAMNGIDESEKLNVVNEERMEQIIGILHESDSLAQKIKEKNVQVLAEEMNTTYRSRLETMKKIHVQYGDVLKEEKNLYGMLGNEEASLQQIDDLVQQLTVKYDAITQLNETFNTLTKEYNEKKQQLYNQLTL